MKYRLSYKIRGHEIDPHYLLQPLFVIHYFHDCFANYCTDHGLAAFHLQKENKTWIMTDIMLEFLLVMPRWREEVIVETWTRNISSLRTEQDFSVFRKNKILAKGTSRWVIIDERNRRPVAYKSLTKILHCHNDQAFENFKFKKIPMINECNYSNSGVIRSDEVDFNKHLNSIKYITKAFETIPRSFMESHSLKLIYAKYMKETKLNDSIESQIKQIDNTLYHQLNTSENNETTPVFKMISKWE